MRVWLAWLLCLFSCVACASVTLIVEPDMGRAPLLNAIKQAQHKIDLVMYGFTDESFTQALIQAQYQRRAVRVLLQHYPYLSVAENTKAINALTAAAVPLHWPDTKFTLTHQKTFLFDDNRALVLTFNLTHSSFTKERNFGLLISDDPLVNKIQQVFNADWLHTSSLLSADDPDLVFSPEHSRARILALITQAQQSIKIYAEGLSDYEVVGALAKAARSGVNVSVLTSLYQAKKPPKQFAYLTRAGVQVRFSQGYLIHAKVMVVDDKLALLGSINFTRPSIDSNRELSIIIHDPVLIRQLDDYYTADWQNTFALRKKAKANAARTMRVVKHVLRAVYRSYH